jgi:hypothetical protein
MKFLCLVYDSEEAYAGLSEAERDGMINAALDSDEHLRRRGAYVGSNALEPPASASCVRVRDGRVLVTDGPFAETKEHLGGYILIEAADKAEAVTLAAGIPQARLGAIEVRPVRLLARR